MSGLYAQLSMRGSPVLYYSVPQETSLRSPTTILVLPPHDNEDYTTSYTTHMPIDSGTLAILPG